MESSSLRSTFDQSQRNQIAQVLKRHLQGSAVLAAILIIVLVTSLQSDAFLTKSNLLNLLSQASILGILSVGMAVVMISGGIDLSIGALVSLTGVICGKLLIGENSFWLVLPGTVAAGAAIGMLSGVVIAKSRVQPFVVTLGGLSLFQGLALLVVNGEQIPLFTEGAFNELGTGKVLGVPIAGLVFLGVAVAAHWMMNWTRVGRNLYAIGGNETAAYLSGVNVDRYKIAVYAALGGLGGLASVILASKIGGALPLMGSGLELQAIAAVVIGGVSLFGGRGSVIAALLGVALLAIIQNSLNLMGIESYYQTIIVGAIIIVAVVSSRSQRAERA